MTIVILLMLFLIIMLSGVPVSFATGAASILYILTHAELPNVIIAQRIFVASDSFSLMAIPLFILAGELMNQGGLTKKIVRLSSTLVGHISGGLSLITVLACMIFAGMSGSSAAAAASVGSMMIPAMKENGYDDAFTADVTAVGAVLGPIIPPSIAMVMYGAITGFSTGKLFIGGVFPGILTGCMLMLTAYTMAKRRGYKAQKKISFKEVISAFKNSILALLMPIIIVGGILAGIFTATEAGAIGTIYGIILGLVTKEIKIKDLPRIFINAAKTTAIIMFIVGTAMLFGWILTQAQVPQMLVKSISSVSKNPTIIFFVMLGLLLILGCFMIDAAVIPLCTPLFLPIIKQFGIDPIHFGVVMCMMTTTGGITPPVGNLLFIACQIAGVPVTKAVKTLIPFFFTLIAAIIICTLIPQTVTFLPSFLK